MSIGITLSRIVVTKDEGLGYSQSQVSAEPLSSIGMARPAVRRTGATPLPLTGHTIMPRWERLRASIVSTALLIAACGGGDDGGPNTPPPAVLTVDSMRPAAGTTDAFWPLITLYFSGAVDPSTLTYRQSANYSRRRSATARTQCGADGGRRHARRAAASGWGLCRERLHGHWVSGR